MVFARGWVGDFCGEWIQKRPAHPVGLLPAVSLLRGGHQLIVAAGCVIAFFYMHVENKKPHKLNISRLVRAYFVSAAF